MALLRRCMRHLWIRNTSINLCEIDARCRRVTQKIRTNNDVSLQTRTKTSSVRYHTSSVPRRSFAGATVPGVDAINNNTNEQSQADSIPKITCYSDLNNWLTSGKNQKWSQESSLIFLESCLNLIPDAGLSERQDLIRQIWEMFIRSGLVLTVEHYNTLLKLHCRNSQIIDAAEFIKNMKAQPNNKTYQLLLEAVGEIGDYRQALAIITRMKNMEYPTTEATFNALILVHSTNSDCKQAEKTISVMEAAMIKPSSATYSALARGYARKGDLRNLKRIINLGDLNVKEILSIVKSLSLSGHGECISEVMKYLPAGVDLENIDVVETIIELIHLRRAKEAFQIVDNYQASIEHGQQAVRFADFFLYEIVKACIPWEEILYIAESLITSEKNKFALVKVAEVALRLKYETLALTALQTMPRLGHEVRPHYYWPLLVNAASRKRDSDIMRIIKHMFDNNVHLDDDTLYFYTFPFLKSKEPLLIVRKLQDCGANVSDVLMPLTATLLNKGDLNMAISLNITLKGRLDREILINHLLDSKAVMDSIDLTLTFLSTIQTNSEQNARFLMELLESEKIQVTNEQLTSLISAFEHHKLKISPTCVDVVQQRLCNSKQIDELSRKLENLVDKKMSADSLDGFKPIPHPKNMSVDELECHFLELQSKGLNTRGILRKLIQVQCRENNLERVQQLMKIFDENGFQWTSGLLSNVFSLYANNNLLDEAKIRYDQLKMNYKNFHIDDFKILDYATALVKDHRLDEAFDVLKVQTNVKGTPDMERNCWRFMNAVAAGGSSEQTNTALNLLIKKGYCKINNHLLGTLIRVHLATGDVESAIKTFEHCVSTYKKTPLRQELLLAILRAHGDKTNFMRQINEVIGLIRRIHGPISATSHLIMALASTNNQTELHKLIKMGKFDPKSLKLATKKLEDDGDSTTLHVILKASRGVKNLDTTDVYDAIMAVYARSGDYKAALILWDKLITDEKHPSPKFVSMLRNILISHDVPIPAELNAIGAR